MKTILQRHLTPYSPEGVYGAAEPDDEHQEEHIRVDDAALGNGGHDAKQMRACGGPLR